MRKLLLLTITTFIITNPAVAKAKCTSGDCQNSVSVFTFTDGDVYVGDFKNGQLHGQGKLGFTKGGYYEGGFRDGKFNGKGVLVYANGKSVEGDFADNKLVPPPSAAQSANPWELSDEEIMTMLTRAAQAPNQTKYLDQNRIASIKKGWQEEQITEREKAIEAAFDYLLRVNDHHTLMGAKPELNGSENDNSAMQRFFTKRRSEEEQQRRRDIAEGEKRLAAMSRRTPGDILEKCQADWPDDYAKQKSCIQKQGQAKNWVKAHGGN